MTRYEQTLGALIGLARAALNEERTDALRDTLEAALSMRPEMSDEQLLSLRGAIRACKKTIVPNCFVCASPCGRTDDYDIRLIALADPDEREAKEALLALTLASSRADASEDLQNAQLEALCLLGEELPAGLLRAGEEKLRAAMERK